MHDNHGNNIQYELIDTLWNVNLNQQSLGILLLFLN